jgi:cytochrome c551
MLKKMCVLTIGLVLAVSLSACGGNKTATPTPTPAPVPTPVPAPAPAPSGAPTGGTNPPSGTTGGTTTVDAQAVFKQNCVTCHGVDLGGGAGPNLQKVGARLSADQIAATITNGRGGMPPFKDKLKAEEIDALSKWLAAHK